jgi:hypothetical protein
VWTLESVGTLIQTLRSKKTRLAYQLRLSNFKIYDSDLPWFARCVLAEIAREAAMAAKRRT